jgi:hypothetical protein
VCYKDTVERQPAHMTDGGRGYFRFGEEIAAFIEYPRIKETSGPIKPALYLDLRDGPKWYMTSANSQIRATARSINDAH